MAHSRIESLKTKAKLLQKAKKAAGTPIRLKDAFLTLARAAGFSSWQDFRATLDANEALFPRGHSAFWKVWYKSYDEARAHLAKNGGTLLPYQNDFVIVDADYLRFLGLEDGDADLAAIGPNWAEPRDAGAYARLLRRVSERR